MAQGSIRVRCKTCRAQGAKEGECKHRERNFNALFPRPGGGQDSATFKSKNEAELFLADKRLEYHKNPEYRKQKNVTFSDLADQWLLSKEKTISPRSWTNCNLIVQNHLKPKLGHVNINSIRPSMIQDARNAVAHMSFWHRSKVNWMVRAIFKHALVNGLISKDPAVAAERLKNTKPTVYTILNQEQVQALIESPAYYTNKFDARANVEWRRKTLPLIYRIALFTGLRPSENFAITRDCIDFKKKEIRVNKTIVWFNNDKERELAGAGEDGQWQFRPPKTKAGNRVLPIGDDLIKAIQIYLIEMPENPHNLLFVGPKGIPLREGVFMNRYFNDDLKRAGCAQMRFYDLRHTFCTIAVASMKHSSGTVDLQRLQYLMGHEKLTTTLDIYTHLFPADDRPIANQMESFIYGKPKAPDAPEARRVTAVSL